MKKILSVFLIFGLLVSQVFAETPQKEEVVSKVEVNYCPKTKLTDSCMMCHVVPDWTLKEKEPYSNRVFPKTTTMFLEDEGKTAVVLVTNIESPEIEGFFEYVKWHPEINKCIFEIHSPGGSLFEAWRIVGLMNFWKAKGMIVETRCYGFAASAGFIVFLNGTPGHRFASPTAELMWHELYSFAFFKISRPSDVEDEAVILRHLQDTASTYLAKRSILTKEEWDEKVRKKEFWCNGAEATNFGISDGIPK